MAPPVSVSSTASASPCPANNKCTMTVNSLRSLRRNFLNHHLEQRPLVEMMQYGSVTLIHKKLDSWIDAKPQLPVHHYSEGVDGGKMRLDDSSLDHLSRRVCSLCKRRSKVSRSWSGNINLIHKESLIDVLPANYNHNQSNNNNKRSKPRRMSGEASDKLFTMRKHIHPKDVLLDGDLQTVRKVILEKKLGQRPLIPYVSELDSATELVPVILHLQQQYHDHDRLPQFYTHKNKLLERGIHRATSLNSAMFRQHIRVMPSSA